MCNVLDRFFSAFVFLCQPSCYTDLWDKLDGVGPADNRPSTDLLHHDMWHMTCDSWSVTRDRWEEVNLLSKLQLPSSYGLGVKVLTKIAKPSYFCVWNQNCKSYITFFHFYANLRHMRSVGQFFVRKIRVPDQHKFSLALAGTILFHLNHHIPSINRWGNKMMHTEEGQR